MEMVEIWRAFAAVAGPAAVSALWQGAVLALGLMLCLRLTPRISAIDRFRVWGAGFAVSFLLPFLPGLLGFFHSFLIPAGAASGLSGVGAQPAHPWFDLDPRWSLAIAAVWMAASLARAIDLGVHTVRLRRLWMRATPVALPLGDPSARTGTKRRFEVCTTRDLDRPSVIGFWAPRILLPEWLLDRLTAEELEQVVLHEAEHLRRRDDWINLAQKLCLVAFPLNPALAWMERRLCREREIACDEGVVRRTQAPRAYAACLASLAERRFEREHRMEKPAEALSLGAWQRRPELVDRVHSILRHRPGLPPAAARALLGVVGCGLVFASVELAHCPQIVEFAARPPALAPTLAAANASAMADGRPLSGFHMVDTVAHLPGRAELAAARRVKAIGTRSREARKADRIAGDDIYAKNVIASTNDRFLTAGNSRNDRDAKAVALAETAATATKLTLRPQDAQSQHQSEQWIVFTTWEEVESTSSAPIPAADSATPAPQVVRRYTVTRLVLRVYPAASRGSAIESGPTSKTTISPLPAAIPVRDGWLVLQL